MGTNQIFRQVLLRCKSQHLKHFTRNASFHHLYKNFELLEPRLEEVKSQLQQLEGGQVFLKQDESTGIAQICIDHFDKKNSLSGKMMVELHEAVVKLEGWVTGKGLLLYSQGNGDTFCSGGFLETMKKLSREDAFRMSVLMQNTASRLRNLPVISVAVVHGQALGGGAELTLWPDFRLFSPSAELGFVQARMGITTGWGGGMLLKAMVGHQKALDFLLTGRKIKIDEAQSLGLVDGVLPSSESRIEDAHEWLLSKIKYHAVDVVHAVKMNVISENYSEERQVFGSIWGGTAHMDKFAKNIKHK